MGSGIFLPCLVVNIHPASAHTLDMDSPTIHVNLVSVDRGNGNFGGIVSSPPFNQQFFNRPDHLTNWFLMRCTVDMEEPVSFAVLRME